MRFVMNKYLLSLIVLLLLPIFVQAQGHRMDRGRATARLEQLERARLIEVLDMNEETSVKFFARRKDFVEKRRALQWKMDDLVEQMESETKEGKKGENDPWFRDKVNELITTQSEMVESMRTFTASLGDILTTRQIAEYVVFERRFREEVKDILLKKGKRHIRNR